jgi:hypothetical protein
MATERQIAANRRNAQKSTGPRSVAGRKRSSQNAYRHGLSLRISTIELETQIDILARQIAGDATDTRALAWAKIAAEAELEKQRVSQFRTAIYERIMMYGGFDGLKFFQSDKEEFQWYRANIKWLTERGSLKLPYPSVIDPLATMPNDEPFRSAEATRRLLPELISLLRYEERAAGRRDRAIRSMMRAKGSKAIRRPKRLSGRNSKAYRVNQRNAQ